MNNDDNIYNYIMIIIYNTLISSIQSCLKPGVTSLSVCLTEVIFKYFIS